MAEVNPAADKIAAKGIFFIRYTIKPMANMHNPCPKSPNIAPKRSDKLLLQNSRIKFAVFW